MVVEQTLTQLMGVAKTQLLMHHPFYGVLLSRIPVTEDNSPENPTMCTNGKWIKYNREFTLGLTKEERIGVLVHEVLHIALMHHLRRKHRDPQLYNIAADYVINLMIKEASKEANGSPAITLPKGALLDDKYAGMSTEQVYNYLQNNPKEIPNVGDGFGMGGVVDAPGNSLSGETYKEMEAEVKEMLAQAIQSAKKKGNVPGALQRLVDDELIPQVAWEYELARFMTQRDKSDYTFARPNRRHLTGGFYLPSMEGLTLGDVWLFVDTSGSIDQKTLAGFTAEMRYISSNWNKGVNVLYIDAEVQGEPAVLEPWGNEPLECRGGGGTCFRPGFDFLEQQCIRPEAVVYLTDGYCNTFADEPGYDVLWVVWGNNKSFEPPYGEVIHLE